MAQPDHPADPRTLAADLFAQWHEPVLALLVRRHPFLDRDLLHDAFVQALLELCARPERFDPARGNWRALLVGAARCALRPLLRSDARRRLREEKWAGRVAAGAPAARPLLDALADRELAEKVRQAVARTEEERRFLRLWEQGVEDTGEYAHALGLEGRPEEEVTARVKVVRDRLTARLRRLKDGPLGGVIDP
jgi:hypothetical protein